MTMQKSFKTRIRERMEKTGESYTTARQQLIDRATRKNGTVPDDAQVIAISGQRISDEAVARRTDRAWDEWFELLDAWDATERTHAEIARWLSEEHEVEAWWAQSITVGYEQARGMRAPGERPDGKFSASASKTVNVSAETAFEAIADETIRARWLPDVGLTERTSTPPKSYRADWQDDGSMIAVWITEKGDAKCQIGVQHEKIGDADRAGELKAYWRTRLSELKAILEG